MRLALALTPVFTAAAQDCDWTRLTTPTPSLSSLSVVYDPVAARTLAVGIQSPHLRVYSYTPAAGWTLLTASSSIPPLSEFSIAFDSDRQRLVLFGGFYNGVTYGETWEWDGATWHFITASGPAPRTRPVMQYDPALQQTLLFGGRASFSELADTWIWNGATWQQHTASPAPAGDPGTSTAFDPVRQRIQLGRGQPLETWEWTGSHWLLRPIASPPQPLAAKLFYDTFHQRLTLVGTAFTSGQPAPTVWSTDGSTWTVRAGGPPSLGYRPVIFDQSRSRAVSFNEPAALWEWRPDAAATTPVVLSITPIIKAFLGDAAQFTALASGTPTPTIQWFRASTALTNTPPYSGVTTTTLSIDPIGSSSFAPYTARFTNPCGQSSATTALHVESRCYPNCDRSAVEPFLNVQDYGCFLGAFASGGTYANCDLSTTPPILNVQDFTCFLNAFAAGCSAP